MIQRVSMVSNLVYDLKDKIDTVIRLAKIDSVTKSQLIDMLYMVLEDEDDE